MSRRVLVAVLCVGATVAACGRESARIERADTTPAMTGSSASAPAPAAPIETAWSPDSLRRELRDLSDTPPAVAAALFKLETWLFTRIDSANARFLCDEGMPSSLLFVADGRVLDVSSNDLREPAVRVEVVSLAHVEDATFNACTLVSATVQLETRVDTLLVYFKRQNGKLVSDRGRFLLPGSRGDVFFSGALPPSVATVNWQALAARADSVRRAHNQPLARPWPKWHGHYDPYSGVSLAYPEDDAVPCPAASVEGRWPVDSAEIAVAPHTMGAQWALHFGWFALFETRRSPSGGCVMPVTVESHRSPNPYSCPPSQTPLPWRYTISGYASRPALLVRRVDSLRIGPALELYTVVPTGWEPGASPGWNRGALIFSSHGEALRIVEHPWRWGPGARYALEGTFRGRSAQLQQYLAKPGETWDVYWVGLLNGDDVPDIITRTTVRSHGTDSHGVALWLSTPDSTSLWTWVATSYVMCLN